MKQRRERVGFGASEKGRWKIQRCRNFDGSQLSSCTSPSVYDPIAKDYSEPIACHSDPVAVFDGTLGNSAGVSPSPDWLACRRGKFHA